MTVEAAAPYFDERAVEQIRASLPTGIDQRRLDLLPLVLNEWSPTVREHLSRETREISRKRYAQLTKVGKCASHLQQAFKALDQRGWAWIAQEIGREEGSLSVSPERLAETKERLRQEDEFLKNIEAATRKLLEEDKRGPGQPPNIRAYLVMLDIAAIFEWLTDRNASREVDRSEGKETGQFWRFAAAVWPHVFGKGCYGLPAAMKTWAALHSRHGEESQFINNASRWVPGMADIQH
jgi:hypothetical protein